MALGFFQIIYYIQNFGYITYYIVYHGNAINAIKRAFALLLVFVSLTSFLFFIQEPETLREILQ